MNSVFYLPLVAVICPVAVATQEAGLVQRCEDARLERDALLVLQRIQQALTPDADALLPAVDRALFMQGFREGLSCKPETVLEMSEMLSRQSRELWISQIEKADFLTPHAAQPGVVKLDSGVQYDVFVSASSRQNYKARRAHALEAYVPGSRLRVSVSGLPVMVGEAMYEAPRGVAWRFLLPVGLLDEVDAAPLRKTGVHTVEILAVRESLSRELRQEARDYFAVRTPALPVIQLETPGMFALRSRLLGMCVAQGQAGADSRLLARVEAWVEAGIPPAEELEARLEDASAAYDKVREELRRLEHRQIAAQLMQLQEQLPGTLRLSNGLLCRALPGASVPLDQVRYVETEELGTEQYWRVRERVVHAENDLPELVQSVAAELPAGRGWDIIVPPALRGEGEELPLLYRIRVESPKGSKEIPLLPDTI